VKTVTHREGCIVSTLPPSHVQRGSAGRRSTPLLQPIRRNGSVMGSARNIKQLVTGGLYRRSHSPAVVRLTDRFELNGDESRTDSASKCTPHRIQRGSTAQPPAGDPIPDLAVDVCWQRFSFPSRLGSVRLVSVTPAKPRTSDRHREHRAHNAFRSWCQ
jgi:hypothetical protein